MFAKSLPTSAAPIKRELKRMLSNTIVMLILFVKIGESQNYLWNEFIGECPRDNALIKVDSFDLQALCENTRSQNFNHKVASWPRSSTWKQRLLNLSWHWKQITNRAELGTSVWSKNVSSFFRVLIPRNNKTNNYDKSRLINDNYGNQYTVKTEAYFWMKIGHLWSENFPK